MEKLVARLRKVTGLNQTGLRAPSLLPSGGPGLYRLALHVEHRVSEDAVRQAISEHGFETERVSKADEATWVIARHAVKEGTPSLPAFQAA